MQPPLPGETPGQRLAVLVVIDPSGNRTSVSLQVLPFRIGRQAESHLILRDSRASRNHARIVMEGGDYFVEDLGSRHGTYLNGVRITRERLKNGDQIEFGSPDSYQLIFTMDGGEIDRLLDQMPSAAHLGQSGVSGAATNLAKLRAVMEVARVLQTSLTTQEVLASVVDAALAVTGAERGFLLLRQEGDLEMRVARDNRGMPLREADLKVPRRLIQHALHRRRELLSMNFDPTEAEGIRPEHSVADLDLRSVVCVPLVRIRVSGGQETSMLSTINDTVGVLYLDTRLAKADLSAGNRELLQTLALEASTILENARLLEEERIKQKMEEELSVARQIQQSLAPRFLPREGWFRATGSTEPSLEVGGDYYDVLKVNDDRWAAAVADVSGKGVSSALLASYLQGAFSAFTANASVLDKSLELVNRFLAERNEGGKYATVFCCMLDRDGTLLYVNAGHCAPFIVSPDGTLEVLEATAPPIGLLTEMIFPSEKRLLIRGQKIVIISDGITEAHGESREFFGLDRLRRILTSQAAGSCVALHAAILAGLREFTGDAPQSDDVTLVVLEYHGE